MAFWKRRSQAFEPNPPETKYNVHYLGKMPANGKMGLECTMKPVELMYRTFKLNKGKNYQRLSIEITNKGVSTCRIGVTDPAEDGDNKDTFIPIYKMSFGGADPAHSRVFAIVMKNDETGGDNPWECHAFLCEASSVAKALTLYLVKAFQKTAEAWENLQSKRGISTKPKTLHITHEPGMLEHQTAMKRHQPPVSTVKITFNIDHNVDDFDRVGERESSNKHGGQNVVENNRAFSSALAKRDVPLDEQDQQHDTQENGAVDDNSDRPQVGEFEGKAQFQGEPVTLTIDPQVLRYHHGDTHTVATSPSTAKLRKERNRPETTTNHHSNDSTPSKNRTSQKTNESDENVWVDDETESESSRSKKKSVRFSESDSTIPEQSAPWEGEELGDDDVMEAQESSKKSKSSSKGILNGIANFTFSKSKK